MIVLELLQPGRLVGALQGRFGALGQGQEVVGVPAPDLVDLA